MPILFFIFTEKSFSNSK